MKSTANRKEYPYSRFSGRTQQVNHRPQNGSAPRKSTASSVTPYAAEESHRLQFSDPYAAELSDDAKESHRRGLRRQVTEIVKDKMAASKLSRDQISDLTGISKSVLDSWSAGTRLDRTVSLADAIILSQALGGTGLFEWAAQMIGCHLATEEDWELRELGAAYREYRQKQEDLKRLAGGADEGEPDWLKPFRAEDGEAA